MVDGFSSFAEKEHTPPVIANQGYVQTVEKFRNFLSEAEEVPLKHSRSPQSGPLSLKN